MARDGIRLTGTRLDAWEISKRTSRSRKPLDRDGMNSAAGTGGTRLAATWDARPRLRAAAPSNHPGELLDVPDLLARLTPRERQIVGCGSGKG